MRSDWTVLGVADALPGFRSRIVFRPKSAAHMAVLSNLSQWKNLTMSLPLRRRRRSSSRSSNLLIHFAFSTDRDSQWLRRFRPTCWALAEAWDHQSQLLNAAIPSISVFVAGSIKTRNGGNRFNRLFGLLLMASRLCAAGLRGRFETRCQPCNSSSSAFASFKSSVSKPSVNQPYPGASRSRACFTFSGLSGARRGSRPGMCLHRYDKLQLTFLETVDPVP